MIVELTSDEGVVEPGVAERFGHGEVTVIRQAFADEGRQRGGRRLHRRAAEQVDHLAVLRSGLVHLGAAAPAAGIHIHHQPDMFGQRVGMVETIGADEPGFFAVRDQQDHVAIRRTLRFQGPHHLEGGGNAEGVVSRAGGIGHAVIVRHDGKRGQLGVSARQDADDIFNAGALDHRNLRAGDPTHGVFMLDLRGKAHVAHAAEEVVAGGGVSDGTHGVGRPGDHPVVDHGATGGEDGGRRLSAHGFGG